MYVRTGPLQSETIIKDLINKGVIISTDSLTAQFCLILNLKKKKHGWLGIDYCNPNFVVSSSNCFIPSAQYY